MTGVIVAVMQLRAGHTGSPGARKAAKRRRIPVVAVAVVVAVAGAALLGWSTLNGLDRRGALTAAALVVRAAHDRGEE
jgi:hypothetical protein